MTEVDVCHKGMVFEEDGRVYCLACGRTYSDNIPTVDSILKTYRDLPPDPGPKRGRPPKREFKNTS